MKKFKKPNILISRCLEHDNCRYNASMIKSEVVKNLIPHVNFITVCPEMDMGLPAPREALRIVRTNDDIDRLVLSNSGDDYTNQMDEFSKNFLKKLDMEKIDGFVLKHRSPSCGINDVKIYKGTGKSNLLPGKTKGIFAQNLLDLNPDIFVENEGRLRNFNLRESFMIKVFTIASFKDIKNGSMKDLVEFHSINKYLFMACSPKYSKDLGKIVANHDKLNYSDVIDTYEKTLRSLLNKPLDRGRNINVLFHLFGYFKKLLSAEEKAYFLDKMELYNDKKIPYSNLLAILRAWVVRFDEPYLKNQTIFEPFPIELFDVTDSGKGL